VDFTPGVLILRRHWKLVIAVALLAALVAWAGSFLVSPSYVTTTRVLVRAREARFLTSKGQDISKYQAVLDSNLARSLSQTNGGLVKSRNVAERVVRDLRLEERPLDPALLAKLRRSVRRAASFAWHMIANGFYSEPTKYEGLVQQVQKNLQGTPLKDSYLVEVKAKADTGPLAAGIANAATQALVLESRERAQAESNVYRDFLKGQVDRARREVEAAEQAVRQYKEEQGISDVAEQLRLSAASQESLRQQLRESQVKLKALTAERETLRRTLSSIQKEDSTTTTLTTGRSTSTQKNIGPSRVYQDLTTNSANLEAQIASESARSAALTEVLDQLKAGSLSAQEARLRDLELKLSAANDAYRRVRGDYDDAIVNSAQGAIELSQVDTAGVPLYPSGPLRYLFLLVGLLLGLAGGGGIAYFWDRRLPVPEFERAPMAPPLPSPIPQPVHTMQAVLPSPRASEGQARSSSR